MSFSSKQTELNYTISYSENNALFVLKNSILDILPKDAPELVFVCIGSDRSTGDSYGPLVGKILSKRKLSNVTVLGTLENPVHANNLVETIFHIEEKHPDAFVIAIDAALGNATSVGHIIVSDTPIKPGSGVNKDLPAVGDVSIKGVVNIAGFMEFMVLQNTRLYTVYEMADVTANAIFLALMNYSSVKK